MRLPQDLHRPGMAKANVQLPSVNSNMRSSPVTKDVPPKMSFPQPLPIPFVCASSRQGPTPEASSGGRRRGSTGNSGGRLGPPFELSLFPFCSCISTCSLPRKHGHGCPSSRMRAWRIPPSGSCAEAEQTQAKMLAGARNKAQEPKSPALCSSRMQPPAEPAARSAPLCQLPCIGHSAARNMFFCFDAQYLVLRHQRGGHWPRGKSHHKSLPSPQAQGPRPGTEAEPGLRCSDKNHRDEDCTAQHGSFLSRLW